MVRERLRSRRIWWEDKGVDRKEKTGQQCFLFFFASRLDRSTYRGVDGVVLCECDTSSEEGGKDSSEEHCVFVYW